MSSSSFNDNTMTSGSGVTRDVNQVLRLSGAKTNSRYFGFRWKKRHSDDINAAKNLEVKDLSADNLSNTKISSGFLKNIKKRLRIKNLGLCKVKEKIIGSEENSDRPDVESSSNNEKASSFVDERNPIESKERLSLAESNVSLSREVDDSTLHSRAEGPWEKDDPLENGNGGRNVSLNEELGSRELEMELISQDTISDIKNDDDNNSYILHGGNIAEPQSTMARESVETTDSVMDARMSNEKKEKFNLSEQLLKLSKYGWYWGPISGDEADSKLVSEPDGAFLVRDSSDDRYLLTLSFKSSGRLLHARMEHSGGLFSLCNQSENKGFTSVAALIDHSMNSSQSAVFCYSRPKYPGYPSFPVRLTKPVSRFTQVRSLQYLCRFVIRQNTRLDNIHKLPLPKTIRGYIEEAHY